MNLHVVQVYGLALHEFPIAQVDRVPARCLEVIGSNPVGDSDFFSAPAHDMLIISFSQKLFHTK